MTLIICGIVFVIGVGMLVYAVSGIYFLDLDDD